MAKNKTTQAQEFSELFKDVLKTNPQQMLIISLDAAGQINFNTNMPNYPFLHYILNKSIFEVNLHERSSKMEAKVEEKGKEASTE